MQLSWSEQFKLARYQLNYSQKEMANILGVSKRTVIGWENKRNMPRPKSHAQIIKILKEHGMSEKMTEQIISSYAMEKLKLSPEDYI